MKTKGPRVRPRDEVHLRPSGDIAHCVRSLWRMTFEQVGPAEARLMRLHLEDVAEALVHGVCPEDDDAREACGNPDECLACRIDAGPLCLRDEASGGESVR